MSFEDEIPARLLEKVQELMEMVDLSGRAYGWEVGRGAPLHGIIEVSDDNPFLDPNWRENISEEKPYTNVDHSLAERKKYKEN